MNRYFQGLRRKNRKVKETKVPNKVNGVQKKANQMFLLRLNLAIKSTTCWF